MSRHLQEQPRTSSGFFAAVAREIADAKTNRVAAENNFMIVYVNPFFAIVFCVVASKFMRDVQSLETPVANQGRLNA